MREINALESTEGLGLFNELSALRCVRVLCACVCVLCVCVHVCAHIWRAL